MEIVSKIKQLRTVSNVTVILVLQAKCVKHLLNLDALLDVKIVANA
jgi:hypothetical protein